MMTKALFAVRDSSRRKAAPCAFLSYSDEKGFTIDIEPSVTTKDVPAFFVPFVSRGEHQIPSELSLRWVRERVPPPSRQNVGEILKAHGLNEYSELALLRSGKGASSQDSFVVEELYGELAENTALNESEKRRKELGAEIKARRTGLEISQRELADAVRIDQPALSKIEAGKSNVTFDILSSIDQVVSREGRPLISRTLHTLWSTQRRSIQQKLDGYAPDLGQTYRRLINELETYDENRRSSIADSRIISHCFRELMDSFPAYIDGFTLSGMQGEEREALNNLFTLLDRQPLSLGNQDAVTAISPELRDALIKLHNAHSTGSGTNRQKMQVSVSGTKGSEAAPISAWEKAQTLAVQTAHLPRGKAARIPSFAEYHDSLAILENSIESRIGDIYGVKGALFDLIDRANRTDASGGFTAPRPEDIDSFISSVGDGTLRLLAFRKLKNPYWLEALEEADFFASYLALDNNSSSPLHPAPFLSECLKADPERVIDLLKRLSAKGWRSARSFMVEAAMELSDDELEPLSHEFIRWAKEGYAVGTPFWVHCDAEALILRMLESDDDRLVKNGQALFQQLVRLRKHEVAMYPYEETDSCIPDYAYARFIHKVMQLLPLKTRLTISRNMMNQYVEPLNKDRSPLPSRLLAYSLKAEALEEIGFHRKLLVPWIEEHKKAVRDAFQDDSTTTLGRILEQKPLVLRCIMSSLHEHIQSESSDALGVGTRNALKQICLDEETLLNHEYEGEAMPLLGDFAIHGSTDDRERFLHSFMGWLDSWEKASLKDPTPDRAESVTREKRFKALSILSSFPKESLPGYLQNMRTELEDEIGVYDGPREPYKVTTLWGPNSPLTAEDLREKDPEQTLAWLKDWEPTAQDRFALIEHEGVARTLTALVEGSPTFFDGRLSTLKSQKLIHMVGILTGWQNAIKAGHDIPLNDAVQLCMFMLSDEGENGLDAISGYERDIDGYQSAMRQIGWFLVDVLKATDANLDKKTLHDILTMLIELRDHALANPTQDDLWNREEDCITASLNALSSIALSGIMQWILRDEAKSPEDIDSAFDALDDALPDSDPSMADTAAFALKLRGLLADHQDWLEARYDRLFGEESPSNAQRLLLAIQVSAFTASPALFDFLRRAIKTSLTVGMNQYPAPNGFGRLRGFAECLGFNLFQLYAIGKLELDDALLEQWLKEASPQVQGSALDEICTLVRMSPETPEEAAYRIRLLWDHLAHEANMQKDSLCGAFQLGASHLYEHDWMRKAILQEARSRDCTLEMRMFFDDVHALATEDPEWGMMLLRSVIEHDEERNEYGYERMPHSLLGLYRDRFGKQASDDVTYCMSELGRMGILDLDQI